MKRRTENKKSTAWINNGNYNIILNRKSQEFRGGKIPTTKSIKKQIINRLAKTFSILIRWIGNFYSLFGSNERERESKSNSSTHTDLFKPRFSCEDVSLIFSLRMSNFFLCFIWTAIATYMQEGDKSTFSNFTQKQKNTFT